MAVAVTAGGAYRSSAQIRVLICCSGSCPYQGTGDSGGVAKTSDTAADRLLPPGVTDGTQKFGESWNDRSRGSINRKGTPEGRKERGSVPWTAPSQLGRVRRI